MSDHETDGGDTPAPFTRDWTVRFSDTDPFGIAHYPRMIDAIHESSDMLMEEIGFPFWELSQEHGYGLPLVEIDFEFVRPVEAGDEVTIAIRPELGTSGVRLEYEATVDGEVAFSGYEQRVCANHGGEGSRPIPDDLRSAFSRYTEA